MSLKVTSLHALGGWNTSYTLSESLSKVSVIVKNAYLQSNSDDSQYKDLSHNWAQFRAGDGRYLRE